MNKICLFPFANKLNTHPHHFILIRKKLYRIQIGNGDIMQAGAHANIDSGSVGIWVPQHVMQDILSVTGHIGFDGNSYLVDCSKVAGMPLVYIYVEGETVVLEPAYYVLKVSCNLSEVD